MIPDRAINVTDLEISRPDRTGPGGDQSADPEVLHENLSARLETTRDVVRRRDGSEVQLQGLLMIDPYDENGDVRDVLAGDLVKFTDFAGRPTTRREIVRLEPHYEDGTTLSHFELGF